MKRALVHAWTVLHFAWTHRRAPRIVVEMKAEYPATESEIIDWQWRFLQAAASDAETRETGE